MGSNWALNELLDKDVDQAIEDSRCHEEFLEHQEFVPTVEDVVMQVQAEVLLDRSERYVICEDLLLEFFHLEVSSDLHIVDVAVFRQSEP